jgi:hypothetical protein
MDSCEVSKVLQPDTRGKCSFELEPGHREDALSGSCSPKGDAGDVKNGEFLRLSGAGEMAELAYRFAICLLRDTLRARATASVALRGVKGGGITMLSIVQGVAGVNEAIEGPWKAG